LCNLCKSAAKHSRDTFKVRSSFYQCIMDYVMLSIPFLDSYIYKFNIVKYALEIVVVSCDFIMANEIYSLWFDLLQDFNNEHNDQIATHH